MNEDVPSLSAALSDPDPAVRGAAAQKLAEFGSQARGAAVPLVRAAGDDDEDVCEWATAALEELGAPDAEDVGRLSELLKSGSADTGYWAATLIGRLEATAAPAVGALIVALTSSQPSSVRQRAAWALGQVGPHAASAKDALEQAGSSDDSRLAQLARRALELIQR